MSKERKRQQQKQQAMFIEQQKFEKVGLSLIYDKIMLYNSNVL